MAKETEPVLVFDKILLIATIIVVFGGWNFVVHYLASAPVTSHPLNVDGTSHGVDRTTSFLLAALPGAMIYFIAMAKRRPVMDKAKLRRVRRFLFAVMGCFIVGYAALIMFVA